MSSSIPADNLSPKSSRDVPLSNGGNQNMRGAAPPQNAAGQNVRGGAPTQSGQDDDALYDDFGSHPVIHRQNSKNNSMGKQPMPLIHKRGSQQGDNKQYNRRNNNRQQQPQQQQPFQYNHLVQQKSPQKQGEDRAINGGQDIMKKSSMNSSQGNEKQQRVPNDMPRRHNSVPQGQGQNQGAHPAYPHHMNNGVMQRQYHAPVQMQYQQGQVQVQGQGQHQQQQYVQVQQQAGAEYRAEEWETEKMTQQIEQLSVRPPPPPPPTEQPAMYGSGIRAHQGNPDIGVPPSQDLSPEALKRKQQLDAKMDTVDPEIVRALKDPQNTQTVLNYERQVVDFVNSGVHSAMQFEENANTYLKLLAHRIAQRFGLRTTTEKLGDKRGYVKAERCVETRMPQCLLVDIYSDLQMVNQDQANGQPPSNMQQQQQTQQQQTQQTPQYAILQRRQYSDPTSPRGYGQRHMREQANRDVGFFEGKSVAAREEMYDQAKERIFNDANTDNATGQATGQRLGQQQQGGGGVDHRRGGGGAGGRGAGKAILKNSEEEKNDPDYQRQNKSNSIRYRNKQFDMGKLQAEHYNNPANFEQSFPPLVAQRSPSWPSVAQDMTVQSPSLNARSAHMVPPPMPPGHTNYYYQQWPQYAHHPMQPPPPMQSPSPSMTPSPYPQQQMGAQVPQPPPMQMIPRPATMYAAPAQSYPQSPIIEGGAQPQQPLPSAYVGVSPSQVPQQGGMMAMGGQPVPQQQYSPQLQPVQIVHNPQHMWNTGMMPQYQAIPVNNSQGYYQDGTQQNMSMYMHQPGIGAGRHAFLPNEIDGTGGDLQPTYSDNTGGGQ